MIAFERYKYICSLIEKNGIATINELAKELNVSGETVRRDLLYLEKQNKLIRTHGGAISAIQKREIKSLDMRVDELAEKKEELSKYAVSLISEDDIIAIDSGSTAIKLCEEIARRIKKLTVITNHIDIIEIFKSCPDYTIITCGGCFLPEENAFYGDAAIETLKKYHVSKAFIFPSAISLKNGVASCNLELAGMQKTFAEIADSVIILADSSKFERSGFIKLFDISPLCTFVTDSSINEEIVEFYKEKGIDIIKGERKTKK